MLSIFLVPSNFLIGFWTLGLILQHTRRAAAIARRVFWVTTVLLATLLWTPVSAWVAGPLQNKFPSHVPALALNPQFIFHLSGAERPKNAQSADDIHLNDQFARYFELQRLAKAYPEATIIFSGGYTTANSSDLKIAKNIYHTMGLSKRAIFLGDAENTCGNAREIHSFLNTQDRLKTQNRQGPALLVTSAMHMPRSILCFQAAGIDVIAAPAPPISSPETSFSGWLSQPIDAEKLRIFDLAAHEWAGIIYYRITGRIKALWPQEVA